MKSLSKETPMLPPFSPLLRRMLAFVFVSFMILAATMPSWWATPGGAGTATALMLADRICPDAGRVRRKPVVVDGAHALDRAVLRRIAAGLGIGLDCFEASIREKQKGLDEQPL